jgi:pyruvate,water dikinase
MEDLRTTSNAGQLLSLVVRRREEFATALAQVVEALPRSAPGVRLGAVFVQPLVEAEEAGVAFFDGFYYERTQAAGGNQELTAGHARGTVGRGHLERGDPWSEWLAQVYRVFGEGQAGDRRLDIEFARDRDGFVLLQVRPALFSVARNELLTLANHKETLGERPSPWIVSGLVAAGRDFSFLQQIEPAIRRWEDVYAVELGERAWLNLSFWFRWMDHFGLPRTFTTRGVGGDFGSPADQRPLWGRFLRAVPRLFWQQWLSVQKARDASRALRNLDAQIEKARGLAELHQATVAGLVLALHTNYAIAGLCSSLALVRRALHVPGSARLVTQEMMEAYSRLAYLPDPAARQAELDAWLKRYGHRGPLESDLSRPRFAELRPVLWQDLQSTVSTAAPRAPVTPICRKARLLKKIFRPFFWMDERREWFRDATMGRWQRLRVRILEEAARLVAAGQLDRPEDVFWLRGCDLETPVTFRAAADASRQRAMRIDGINLPLTATREEIQNLLQWGDLAKAEESGRRVFPGIPLNPAVIEGRAVKADDLTMLLAQAGQTGDTLGTDRILVVPSLEPSWAVIFPRVGGVVAEVGGELSHASILLREARRPALVNCSGIYRRVHNGDQLRLDGSRGVVEVMESPEGSS